MDTTYEVTCTQCDTVKRTVTIAEGEFLPSNGKCPTCGGKECLELFEVELDIPQITHNGEIRTFSTGATRDTDEGKLDFDGFLSPLALSRFANYMHSNRIQSDGSLRASDNWQKGIPQDQYRKSMWRHFFSVWARHIEGEQGEEIQTDLCALMFNVQGMLHEILAEQKP